MPLLPHPLEEASRRARAQVPAVRALVDLVVDLRLWKVAYGVHHARLYSSEYILTQTAVAFTALWELHASAIRASKPTNGASGRESLASASSFLSMAGTHEQIAATNAATSVLAHGYPHFLSSTRIAEAARLASQLKVASASADNPVVPLEYDGTLKSSTDLRGSWTSLQSSKRHVSGDDIINFTSAYDAPEHFVGTAQMLADNIQQDFFASNHPNPPPGSRSHPTVFPFLQMAGSASEQASDISTLVAALKGACSKNKLANVSLLHYINYYSHHPQPPRGVILVDFQGLPNFLQLPHFHSALIDFWWHHHRFPALQPFPAVASALCTYLKNDTLAYDLWEQYRACAVALPLELGDKVGQHPWHEDDLGAIDVHQHITPTELAQILPCDALYDTSIGDWVVWRLLGWLYLALEIENSLYAMRKQLPLTEHVKPVDLMQSVMNLLRARYGYTREAHSRLAQLSLKLVHRPYPAFAQRFHMVPQFLSSLHTQIAELTSKPYLQLSCVAQWSQILDDVRKHLRSWCQAHDLPTLPDVESADPVPSDIQQLLMRPMQACKFSVNKLLINPMTLHTRGSEGARWMGMLVRMHSIAPATSWSCNPAILNKVAHAVAAGVGHPHIATIHGCSMVQGHWVLVEERNSALEEAGDNVDGADPILAWARLVNLPEDAARAHIAHAVAGSLWMLACADLHIQFRQSSTGGDLTPAARAPRLVLTRPGAALNAFARFSNPPIVKLSLADALVADDLGAACDSLGVTLFLSSLLMAAKHSRRPSYSSAVSAPSPADEMSSGNDLIAWAIKEIAQLGAKHADSASNGHHDQFYQKLCAQLSLVAADISSTAGNVNSASPSVGVQRFSTPVYQGNRMSSGSTISNMSYSLRAASPAQGLLRSTTSAGHHGNVSQYGHATYLPSPANLISNHGSVDMPGNRRLASVSPQHGEYSDHILSMKSPGPLYVEMNNPSKQSTDLHRSQSQSIAIPSVSVSVHANALSPHHRTKSAQEPIITSHHPVRAENPVHQKAAIALPGEIPRSKEDTAVAAEETWARALAFYRNGYGDLSAAFPLFSQIANRKEYAASLYYMADSLYYGSKTSTLRQDTYQAFTYYEKALLRGIKVAQVGIGDCVLFGFDTQNGSSQDQQCLSMNEARLQRAEKSYDAVLELQLEPTANPPVNAKVWARALAGRGDIEFSRGHWESATKYYADAVRLDPGPSGVSETLLNSAVEGGSLDPVKMEAARALRTNPSTSGAESANKSRLDGPGCRRAYARLAELCTAGHLSINPSHSSNSVLKKPPEVAQEFLKRARGCRREVLAKAAWLRACGDPAAAAEYEEEYLWRYPLDY